jgi:hypothetical protein
MEPLTILPVFLFVAVPLTVTFSAQVLPVEKSAGMLSPVAVILVLL